MLKKMPHITRATLLDNSKKKDQPTPVVIYSELLYGELDRDPEDKKEDISTIIHESSGHVMKKQESRNDPERRYELGKFGFIENVERKLSLDERFGPDGIYTPLDGALLLAWDHILRGLVSLRIARLAHGDIKEGNMMVTRRRNHSFRELPPELSLEQVVLRDDERIIEKIKIPTDPSTVHPAVWDYVQQDAMFDDFYLALMDFGTVHFVDQPLESKVNPLVACTVNYVDPGFALYYGAYPNFDTDLYASVTAIQNVIMRRLSRFMLSEQAKEKPLWPYFQEKLMALKEIYNEHIVNTLAGNVNIYTAIGIFRSLSSKKEIEAFERYDDGEYNIGFAGDLTPSEIDYLEGFVKPPFKILMSYQRSFIHVLREMSERGFYQTHETLITLLESGLKPNEFRGSIGPDASESRLIPLRVLENFRNYYLGTDQ